MQPHTSETRKEIKYQCMAPNATRQGQRTQFNSRLHSPGSSQKQPFTFLLSQYNGLVPEPNHISKVSFWHVFMPRSQFSRLSKHVLLCSGEKRKSLHNLKHKTKTHPHFYTQTQLHWMFLMASFKTYMWISISSTM